jgi:hypothetical protein
MDHWLWYAWVGFVSGWIGRERSTGGPVVTRSLAAYKELEEFES